MPIGVDGHSGDASPGISFHSLRPVALSPLRTYGFLPDLSPQCRPYVPWLGRTLLRDQVQYVVLVGRMGEAVWLVLQA